MTATAHALVSAAIAHAIPTYLSIPLAFGSHFIMDAVPHWDFGTNWRRRSKRMTGALAIAETIFGITVAYFLFAGKVEPLPLLLTIIAGELPDWMEAPYYIFFAKQKKHAPNNSASFWERLTYKIYRVENVFHTKTTYPFGVFTQIATVAFFLLLLK